MLKFLKYVFATIVALFLFFFLSFWIFYLFIPSDEVKIEDNSVLKLSLNQPILERSVDNPLSDLDFPLQSDPSGIGLIELRETIKKAKTDDKIKGIFLSLSFIQSGFATIEELRNELIEFKKSKKFIYAYGEFYSEGAYYLASVADKIYLNPAGEMELNGLSSTRTFYKGTLDKLEIKPMVFRVGTYKSAVEPYLLDKMSEASREQTTSYLNSMYDFYLKNVSKSRNIPQEELKRISDKMLVRSAKDALTHKLVTHLAYYDEVETALKKALKIEKDSDINFVGFEKYERAPKIEKKKHEKSVPGARG